MSIFKKIADELKEYFWILIGAFITAISINIFMLPYKIAPGGVSGIATIIFYLSDERFPVGVTMFALNIPLFIAGVKYIGKKFIVKTLFGTMALSFIIDTTEPISKWFVTSFITGPESLLAPDLLLYSLIGGVLMGIGLGLVFRSGATTGGTDLAARIVHAFLPYFSIGQLLLFIDTCVILFAALTFESFQLGLYGIVALYISSKAIDAILEGVNYAKAVFIISEHSEKIAERIMTDLDRGVTSLRGMGMYTRRERDVLFCVVQRRQLPQLKEIVKHIDRKAFVILTEVREVVGEGFQTYD